MEVILILACFISNALALDSLFKDKKKITGMLIVLNLCLTVALAYQFEQIENIFYVLLTVLGIVVIFFGVKFYLKKKHQNAIIVDAKEIEHDEDN